MSKTTVGLIGLLLVVWTAPAQAGVLSLTGEDHTKPAGENGETVLQGGYSLENVGDEALRNVTVTIQVGAWKWAAIPEDLEVRRKKEWTVSARVDREKLECSNDENCAGLTLASRGVFPKVVTRLYQDLNGYQFSFVDVAPLPVGDLSSEELGRIYTAPLSAVLQVAGKGGSFHGELRVTNAGSEDRQVAAAIVTSAQFIVHGKPQVLKVKANSTVVMRFDLENFSALVRSNNPVYAIVQWNEGPVRALALSQATVLISAPDSSFALIAACAGLALLSAVVVFFALRRHGAK